MNAMGMFLPNTQVPGAGKNQMKQFSDAGTDDSSLFQLLLTNLNRKDDDSHTEVLEGILHAEQTPEGIQTALLNLLKGDDLPTLSNSTKDQAENMLKLVEQLYSDQKPLNDAQATNLSQSTSQVREKLLTQLSDLVAQAQKLINQITTVTDQKQMKEAAPRLLQILKEWTTLSKQALADKQVGTQMQSQVVKEAPIFEALVQNFSKRNQLVTKQQYNSAAEVTATDVAKWMKRAIENHGLTEKVGIQTITPSSMPMSRAEQLTFHLNQSQSTQSNDQQLMEQFQKLIKSSKFSALNGTNQLNITLRPGNLGDMVVKLTQINGEMTVKILVSSQAAKEMLDSNMNQLRHMFSPQQVVVEKQEINLQHDQAMQKETTDEHSDNQQHAEHTDQQEDNNDEEAFAMAFEEALLNEKV